MASKIIPDDLITTINDFKSSSNGQMINIHGKEYATVAHSCLLYTSPSPRDGLLSRMPSSA